MTSLLYRFCFCASALQEDIQFGGVEEERFGCGGSEKRICAGF